MLNKKKSSKYISSTCRHIKCVHVMGKLQFHGVSISFGLNHKMTVNSIVASYIASSPGLGTRLSSYSANPLDARHYSNGDQMAS